MISHRYKFIFVWIPRNAGTSINFALMKFGLAKYGVPGSRRDFYPIRHKTAAVLKAREDYAPYWDSYFKFAIVRNPWDWIFSVYWRYSGVLRKKGIFSFGEYLDLWEKERQAYSALGMFGFAGQYDMVHDTDGEMLVDFVGRYEHLDQSFREIVGRIGIDTKLEHYNSSNKGDYKDAYTPADLDHVRRILYKEIEVFGYNFNGV